MGRLLRQYKAGKMSLRKYEKLVPVVAQVVEIMQEIEGFHIGFLSDGNIDDHDFVELECEIDWMLNVYTDDEVKIIKMMANDELGYQQVTADEQCS